MRNRIALLLSLLIATIPGARASETIFLPNLGTGLTGTSVSAKKAADVYVAGGTLTFSEQATAAQGAVLPSLLKVIAGTDGTNIFGIKTDTNGRLQIDIVSSALPSGAATSAKQDTGNTSLSSIDTKLSSQATATKQDTGNTSLGSIDTKLSSQATAAKQDTGNTSLSSIDGKLGSLGQKAMAGSAPVVLASDQAAIPVTVSGVSTAALQSTGNTSLSSIDGKLGSLGQKTMAASAPVVLASDQASIPVSVSGVSTAALQTTGNTSLSTIATNTGKVPLSVTGSGSAAAATVSTVITASAPANAVGFVLMNLDTSTANIRWSVGRTATTTLGQQLQPGRDTGFIPIGANVSLVAESGTQNYDIQWVAQ